LSSAAGPGRPSTRREIITLLCAANRTIAELAGRLEISRNAVREHLERLVDDGLVQREVVRRGVGKPAHEYRLSAEGESAVSSAYLPVLVRLVRVLSDRLDPPTFEWALRSAGVRLGSDVGVLEGDLLQRAGSASAVLRRLGGDAVVVNGDHGPRLECTCCAIGALVADQPLGCKLMESALTAMLGTPVREECNRGVKPQCRFQISPMET
jgi:DeoR family transcriptional regulator, suf operon transcriptional repressor